MSEHNGDNFSELELQALKSRAFTSELKGLIDKVIEPRIQENENALMRDYHALFYRIVNDIQRGGGTLPAGDPASGITALVQLFERLQIKDYAVYNYDFSQKAYITLVNTATKKLPSMITSSLFTDNGVDIFRDYLYRDSLFLTGNAAIYRLSKHSLDSFPPLPLIAFSCECAGRERETLVDSVALSREFFSFISSSTVRTQFNDGLDSVLTSIHISALYHGSASSSWFILKSRDSNYEGLCAVKRELARIVSETTHMYVFFPRGLVIFASQGDVSRLNTYYLELRVKSDRQYILTEITHKNEHQLLNSVLASSAG